MSSDLQPFPEDEDRLPDIVDQTPDRVLTERAAERVADGWTTNTRRTFSHEWGKFIEWCTEYGRTPLPATAETLASYTTHLIDAGLSPNTIDTALGAIQGRHKAEGVSSNGAAARMALRSYRRERAVQGKRTRQATAITVDQLRMMIDQADPETLSGKRDRALLLLGYNMMGRRSELVALNISDVREIDQGLEVFVATSKTDKDSHGVTVLVPYGTHLDTCAVRTVRAYLLALADEGVTSGPLLRGVDRHGRLTGSPKSAGRAGGRMSGDTVNRIVKRLADRAGLEGVTAHSLRAGPATASAMAGVNRAYIVQQGRWVPTSTAVDAYTRPAQSWEHNPMRKLGL